MLITQLTEQNQRLTNQLKDVSFAFFGNPGIHSTRRIYQNIVLLYLIFPFEKEIIKHFIIIRLVLPVNIAVNSLFLELQDGGIFNL